MLNRSASLTMSTRVLKALPGKLDIKRHSPSILYIMHNSCSHLVQLSRRIQSISDEGIMKKTYVQNIFILWPMVEEVISFIDFFSVHCSVSQSVKWRGTICLSKFFFSMYSSVCHFVHWSRTI